MRYLLDTCTFLWLVQQPRELSKSVVRILDHDDSDLFLSDVSVWEISLKNSVGKLPLPGELREWLPEKFDYHRLSPLVLNREAIFLSGELPRFHTDPFDRLLAAQWIHGGMTILSPDLPLSLLGAARVW